jgi:hypothetical protein
MTCQKFKCTMSIFTDSHKHFKQRSAVAFPNTVKFTRKSLKSRFFASPSLTFTASTLHYATTTHSLRPYRWQYKERKQLSQYQRGEIASAKKFGHNSAELARVFEHPDSTVRTTLKLDPLRDEGKTRRRSGKEL